MLSLAAWPHVAAATSTARSHGEGIRGQCPTNFLVPSEFCCAQKKIRFKDITKTKLLSPKNVFCPLQTLKPGYGPVKRSNVDRLNCVAILLKHI